MKKTFRSPLRAKSNKKIRSKIGKLARPGVLVAVLTTVVLGFALFSLVPYSPAEDPHRIGAASLSEIKNNASFAPLKSVQLSIIKFTNNDVYLRLASTATAFAASIFLYLMLRKWHTVRVAVMTSAMFISSSLFLHLGRLTNTEVMYLTLFPVLLTSSMWLLSKNNQWRLPLTAVFTGLMLYIPGAWLLLLGGLVFFRKYLWRIIPKLSIKMKLLCASLFAITIVPLVYSFVYAQQQIIAWLGYNTAQQLTPATVGSNFLDIPKNLFWSYSPEPIQWLVGTPILDVFAIAMFLLGIYAYWAGFYPAREKLIYGSLILAVLLIGFGNIVTIALLLPLIYIVIANGLAYMLQSWFTVFPNNPFARSLGVIFLTAAIAISCFYQLQRYFVAWPQTDPAKTVLQTEQ
jgi:hypothetical protein